MKTAAAPREAAATVPSPAALARAKQRRNLAVGLAFLAPNILGFLTFTLIPLVFSLVLAFSNWDLRLHNIFKDEHIKFVGLDHIVRMLGDERFYQYLGNTLFFMIGLPIGIALSLISAILLSKDLKGGSPRAHVTLILGAVLVGSCALLAAVGMGATGMTVLLAGVAALVCVGGAAGGSTVYRTLFYIPNFVSGVATMLLWKKLYNPQAGPINNLLEGPLKSLSGTVTATPAGLWQGGLWACLLIAALVAAWACRKLWRMWDDGDVGGATLALGGVVLLIPAVCVVTLNWLPNGFATIAFAAAVVAAAAALLAAVLAKPRVFTSKPGEGVGTGLMLASFAMVVQFVLIGFALVLWNLPADAAGDGLKPPEWLSSVGWAKPAIMIMGLWGAVGSQTMLLYLAALTNVPQELYEAADIDGASRGQKFWNVTWPQLAPTTFFVVVMGVIGGLQGGFEMARVMTQGGPAGSTTTLAYFIYTEGFETGRLGFSSAASWVLFLMVLVVTLFNWRFGNRYVND
jgi:multiple sugar transport system permease protein